MCLSCVLSQFLLHGVLLEKKMSAASADMVCGRPSSCQASTVTVAPSNEQVYFLLFTTMTTFIAVEVFDVR